MFANIKAIKSLAVAPLLLIALSATPAPTAVSFETVSETASVSVSLGQVSSAMGVGAN